MAKDKFPITPAIRMLKDSKIHFEPFLYKYEEKGGAEASAKALGVDIYSVIKTIVLFGEKPFICLMHGNKEISLKELGRQLNLKSVVQCDLKTAMKHTGYVFGGTSPFGTKSNLPVFVQKSILDLPEIYINGGKQGFLVKIDPNEIKKAFEINIVDVIA